MILFCNLKCQLQNIRFIYKLNFNALTLPSPSIYSLLSPAQSLQTQGIIEILLFNLFVFMFIVSNNIKKLYMSLKIHFT